MDPRRFNMIFGGQFDRAEGLVYDCVNTDHIECDPIAIPEDARVIAGVDWGFTDPFVIVPRAIIDGRHYQICEHYRTQQRVTDMIESARRLTNLYGIEHFFCDPSRPDLISEFNMHGIPASAANNEIQKGIEYHYELIKTGKYKIFKESSPHTLDEYATYHYPEPKDLSPDQKQKDELPVDQTNHAMDANRYATMASFNLGKKPNRVIRSDMDTRPKTMDEKIARLKRKQRESY
jgi:phage terminase large subunit